jgi:S-adenosylmethionine:tRNA ribosyltransferase-isomerase
MQPPDGPEVGQRLSDYDFDLPPGQIAQVPLERRDASRLLVVDRRNGRYRDSTFQQIEDVLRPGDVLVANDARVFPARLIGRKAASGGKVELLLCEQIGADSAGLPVWRALGQASKGLKPGQDLEFGELKAIVREDLGEGAVSVVLQAPDVQAALARVGEIPLPPYIRRRAGTEDAERYQTVYAQRPVAAAAPTAGLHFTPGILERLKERGVLWTTLTLHVGPGTFLPVRVEDLRTHTMHSELFDIPEATAWAIAQAKREGRRVIPVGTTALRALEGCVAECSEVVAGIRRTSIFITPGYRFQVADALVTNFHLPRSTLLMLVSAFAGREAILAAYQHAVEAGYRFFSYGDAMFIG